MRFSCYSILNSNGYRDLVAHAFRESPVLSLIFARESVCLIPGKVCLYNGIPDTVEILEGAYVCERIFFIKHLFLTNQSCF